MKTVSFTMEWAHMKIDKQPTTRLYGATIQELSLEVSKSFTLSQRMRDTSKLVKKLQINLLKFLSLMEKSQKTRPLIQTEHSLRESMLNIWLNSWLNSIDVRTKIKKNGSTMPRAL